MSYLSDFNIVINQEEDWSYYAEVTNLPWCFTMWETLSDLNYNLKEAIMSYIWSLKKDMKNFQFNFTAKQVVNA